MFDEFADRHVLFKLYIIVSWPPVRPLTTLHLKFFFHVFAKKVLLNDMNEMSECPAELGFYSMKSPLKMKWVPCPQFVGKFTALAHCAMSFLWMLRSQKDVGLSTKKGVVGSLDATASPLLPLFAWNFPQILACTSLVKFIMTMIWISKPLDSPRR